MGLPRGIRNIFLTSFDFKGLPILFFDYSLFSSLLREYPINKSEKKIIVDKHSIFIFDFLSQMDRGQSFFRQIAFKHTGFWDNFDYFKSWKISSKKMAKTLFPLKYERTIEHVKMNAYLRNFVKALEDRWPQLCYYLLSMQCACAVLSIAFEQWWNLGCTAYDRHHAVRAHAYSK